MIGFWIVVVAYMVCVTIMVVVLCICGLKDKNKNYYKKRIDSLEKRVKKLEEDKGE